MICRRVGKVNYVEHKRNWFHEIKMVSQIRKENLLCQKLPLFYFILKQKQHEILGHNAKGNNQHAI